MTDDDFARYLDTLTDKQIANTPLGELRRAAEQFTNTRNALETKS